MELDPTDVAAQDAARASQESARRVQREQDEGDFKWVMSDPRGRRFIGQLLERTGVYRLSFTGEVNQTVFNEGQRNIGLHVLVNAVSLTPDEYARMLSEKKQHDDRNNRGT